MNKINWDKKIDDHVDEILTTSERICNILLHRDEKGSLFKGTERPTIHEFSHLLEHGIVPILDSFKNSTANYSIESDLKMNNIRQYSNHLKRLSSAIKNQNYNEYVYCIEELRKESMPRY